MNEFKNVPSAHALAGRTNEGICYSGSNGTVLFMHGAFQELLLVNFEVWGNSHTIYGKQI